VSRAVDNYKAVMYLLQGFKLFNWNLMMTNVIYVLHQFDRQKMFFINLTYTLYLLDLLKNTHITAPPHRAQAKGKALG
jgi:hypothetical protein